MKRRRQKKRGPGRPNAELRYRRIRKLTDLRMRKYCARARDGVRCATIEYCAALIDLLVRTRWLKEADAANEAKVAQAITAMLASATNATTFQQQQ